MSQLDKLKKALDDYLAYAQGLKGPEEVGVALEQGWQAINGVTKNYYQARVTNTRALAELPCGHDPSRKITQKEMAAILGIGVSNVNTLVRGGWNVKPQYRRPSVGVSKK